MNLFRVAQFALLCALIYAPLLTPAQAQTSTPGSGLKKYRVEIVIFNYLGPDSSDGEIWHRLSPQYASSFAGGVNTQNNLSDLGRSVQFIELRDLSAIVRKLDADPQYSVLGRNAWTQPLFRKSSSIRVPVGNPTLLYSVNLSPIRPAFAGYVQLFENRLLFIDLNLTFRAPRGAGFANDGADRRFYAIREKRRVKLNEVHYFDHPYFGAIVRVSRASS